MLILEEQNEITSGFNEARKSLASAHMASSYSLYIFFMFQKLFSRYPEEASHVNGSGRLAKGIASDLRRHILARIASQSFLACIGLALVCYFGFATHATLTTVSSLDLIMVFVVAMAYGFWPASIVSLLAAATLDYYFTEPIFHFTIVNPRDWVSLATFETCALVISRLSAKEVRSSREAARHRAEMEHLYELSRHLLLLDLRQPAGAQLVVLVQRIFEVDGVSVFDVNLDREDVAGEWGEEERGIARTCLLEDGLTEDRDKTMLARILKSGSGPSGALVVRGRLSPLVMDALASLAAMAIDRYQSFTKEELTENVRKAEQLRAAVMDALAHEFKTPLASVQAACAGLLESGGLTESQSELASIIEVETSRLHSLCSRLLLAARVDSGKVEPRGNDVNVKDLVFELVAEIPNPADQKRIQVTVDDPDLVVRVDREMLAMILTQYLDNARKYSSPDSQIDIVVRRSYGEAIFSIRNFGSTIALEDRERVFDRFYRLPHHVGTITGTGIGLSVVRKAAAAHHGHVWVVSDAQEGTTFFLSLPINGRRSNGNRSSAG
jgi:two-component system sensor histidine kinase KdpD